ncbi:MAG: UDP-N-acetylmuramoyl-L-alanyl-D-glutamate--2,6-diaminopimelate ligase [Candidatus Paceibacterota bacterium]
MKFLSKKLKKIWWRVKSIGAMRYYGHPSKKLKIVGVTGTNGKTTIATLLYKVATALGYKAGLIGTIENIIVDERREVTHTTPDSVSLTKLLSEMAAKECEYVFMEVSSHALDQNRVWGINFTGGIFTNLTHDHLDYHKNLENYFLSKRKFFRMLSESAFALSNADDERGKAMIEGSKARKFLYEFTNIEGPASLDKRFQGEIIKIDVSGIELKIGGGIIKSKLLGKFNAYNLLAVWSACELLGFDMKKVKNILENIEPPRGRFEHFISKEGVLAIVDYAHTPDALEKVILTAREIKSGGRLISVFGCGGDRDPQKRKIMGKIGASLSDIAIFTSDNPRGEDPEKIIEEMKADLSPEELQKVKTIPIRHKAILEAVKIAQKGDVILVAGKGHEDYQEIKGVKRHFDDMEELKKLF